MQTITFHLVGALTGCLSSIQSLILTELVRDNS